MLPLVYRRGWLIAGFFLLFSILVMALLPAIWFWPDSDQGYWEIPDKWLHGLTFVLLTVWFSGQFARSSYWKIIAGLLVFGALIEACQYFLPYRSAEYGDMFADIAGIAFGTIIAIVGVGGWSMRAELWLREKIE